MTTSDWITILSTSLTMVLSLSGTYAIVAYKLGGINAELKSIRAELQSLSERVSRLEKQMRKVLKKLNKHDYEIRWLKRQIKSNRVLYKP